MIAIPKDKLTSDVPGEGGQANPFVLAFAREKMKEWLAEKRNEGFSQ
jgi:hypothetical protein